MLQLNIGIQMTKATLVAALQQDLVARIVGVGCWLNALLHDGPTSQSNGQQQSEEHLRVAVDQCVVVAVVVRILIVPITSSSIASTTIVLIR